MNDKARMTGRIVRREERRDIDRREERGMLVEGHSLR